MRGQFIITGVSTGIGYALAQAALQAGWAVQGVGRHSPEGLLEHPEMTFTKADLMDPMACEKVEFKTAESGPTVLVNNAGTIGPIGRAGDSTGEEITSTMLLNVVAPMRLTARFLSEVVGQKAVYFTGSGAASYPIEGWSAYCASKAAIHQFAEVLSKEYPEVPVHAFRPGKVDTPMQRAIREAGEGSFPSHDHFVEEFEMGRLVSPSVVADNILKSLDHEGELPVVFSLTEL
ncbi:MAG: hypothetical protein RL754_700 [Bacteroidota bacterium]|jgi:benzil reductase ((S)-benzoin forming)